MTPEKNCVVAFWKKKRGGDNSNTTKYFVGAVAALILPLVTSLLLGPAKPPIGRPPTIEVTSDR